MYLVCNEWDATMSTVSLETAEMNENFEYFPPYVQYSHIHQDKCEGYGSLISKNHILTDNHCYGRYFKNDSYFVVDFSKFYPDDPQNCTKRFRVNNIKNFRQLLIFEFDHDFDFQFHPNILAKSCPGARTQLTNEYYSFKIDYSENVINKKKYTHKFGSPMAVKIRKDDNSVQWLLF
uniref:Uncharacterized protein n=1 Tax=Panagrolaimus sp. JU765 TaxID=591449 RepID=A0AC34RNS1_9BILA